jgi:hypothetical protein
MASGQAAPVPLPRSSIAAVVLHRAEIGLTDEQVGEMEQLDRQREAENAAVREEMAKKTRQGQVAPSSNSSSGGMRGGGMHGGMRGGRSPGLGGGKEGDRAATLEDRFDENDTKAYLDAEGVLTDGQKERAREIASDYREQLYERRENARAKAASTK